MAIAWLRQVDSMQRGAALSYGIRVSAASKLRSALNAGETDRPSNSQAIRIRRNALPA